MLNNLISVLCVEPGKHPYAAYIPAEWDAFKHCLGDGPGYAYSGRIRLEDDAVILYNEEAPLADLKGNRKLGNYIIAGIFYISGFDGSGLQPLSKESLEKYTARFWETESYTWEEVLTSYFACFADSIDRLEDL